MIIENANDVRNVEKRNSKMELETGQYTFERKTKSFDQTNSPMKERDGFNQRDFTIGSDSNQET